MRITNEMLDRLEEVASNSDYFLVGIRCQEVSFSLGEMNHVSHVWEDGEDTGEELNGVCVVEAGSARRVFSGIFSVEYPGEHVAIVASNDGYNGEDYGELVLENAEVIEILK
ncbi:hypothetical protein [Fournierella sp.]|uniref:hypothetical protein n=1 Tax=Allofournierella sp. TaxID=1940256 RepID=UPI0025B82E9B|nr:hypothetical protein [Fournierella sp.]